MRATIKLKLALTFTVIVLLAGGMAWIGVNGLGSLNTTLDNLIKGPVARVELAQDLEKAILQTVRAEKNMIMADTPEQVRKFDAELIKLRADLFSHDREASERCHHRGKAETCRSWQSTATMGAGSGQDAGAFQPRSVGPRQPGRKRKDYRQKKGARWSRRFQA